MSYTKKITYTALMTAIIAVATSIIKIPNPVTNEYIHLGDAMVFLAPVLLGWKRGAFAAGVGSMLADLLSPYAQWAIPTLIIKSAMAALIGLAISLKNRNNRILFVLFVSVAWTIFIFGMKKVLQSGILKNANQLVTEMNDVSSAEQLKKLASVVQWELSGTLLLIIILAVGTGIFLYKKGQKVNIMFLCGMIASGLCMVAGYYFTAFLFYGSHIVPIFSIPMNLIQFGAGFIIAAMVMPVHKHLKL